MLMVNKGLFSELIKRTVFIFAVILLLASLGCTNAKDKDNETDAFLDECEEMVLMMEKNAREGTASLVDLEKIQKIQKNAGAKLKTFKDEDWTEAQKKRFFDLFARFEKVERFERRY